MMMTREQYSYGMKLLQDASQEKNLLKRLHKTAKANALFQQ